MAERASKAGRRPSGRSTVLPSPHRAPPVADHVLQLQSTIGNKATGALLGVQRLGGLPTKAAAKAKGGKAGFHLGVGKTSYGKLLAKLDSYHKLQPTDKVKRKALVVEMQGLVETWRGSAQRTKNRSGDAAKSDFLGELMSLLKVEYYDLAQKASIVDAAGASAAKHADSNRQKIQASLLKAKLKHDDDHIKAMMAKLKAAPLTTNFTEATLGFLDKDPYFKNFWQINAGGFGGGKSPGGALPKEFDKRTSSEQREAAERWLGYSNFTEEQRPNRPAYCAVNIHNNPKGGAPTYGRLFFIWKDSVKDRATFTARDTFAMIGDKDIKDLPQDEMIASSDHMEATLAHNEQVLHALSLAVEGRHAEAQALESKVVKYIEAQVHGGLSMLDVDKLVVPFPETSTGPGDLDNANRNKIKAFAAKYNLTVVWG